MADWQFEVPTTGSKHLPPDSRYVEALSSQGYGFEVAVADLVDNSIDAGAKDVVVHFLRDGAHLVSLLVVDDGRGMDEAQLDVAMTVGGQHFYDEHALGMFGTGLKSASLSQAESVTVVSRTKRTRAAGRRWTMEHARSNFQCDIVDADYAQSLIDRYYDKPILWHGTVVRWDGVKDFPREGGDQQTDLYLSRTVNRLGLHLGLQLHRFLAREDFNITVAVEDVRTGTVYLQYGVEPLDPFAHPASGHADYPQTFVADVDGVGEVGLHAVIWPPKSNRHEFRAVGTTLDRQGFYFYRNNRLVQAGGWNNFRQPEQHLALARVAVDIPTKTTDVFRLTVKKAGVETSPAFAASLEQACDDSGTTFAQYLSQADDVYRSARRQRATTRPETLPPGKGLSPQVRETIEEELPMKNGDPISVLWRKLGHDVFFDIERDTNTIVLNQHYRTAILGGRRGGLNDAPLVKTLMYLLMNKVFESERAGPKQKDNLQLWQSVLVSAGRAEMSRVAGHDA
ncbi:ATP-binding protein [Streptomyces diacarni]|uniref:ATP-binding protein n=1 Tax=Streptomyces diacarni TaxID=2800381 RepID=A0A367EZK6_9ACTN|nr:ATP-binding protein [Streptomyces diacarni]RCG23576.1 ATP-binding protein [Streptomyces diacarni]